MTTNSSNEQSPTRYQRTKRQAALGGYDLFRRRDGYYLVERWEVTGFVRYKPIFAAARLNHIQEWLE